MDKSYESLLPLIRLRGEAPEWIVTSSARVYLQSLVLLSMIAYPFHPKVSLATAICGSTFSRQCQGARARARMSNSVCWRGSPKPTR